MSGKRSFQAPHGMEDLLPERIPLWRKFEETFRGVCERFGYEELRTPSLEFTDLYRKSTGDTTDIVEKQMYTFGEGEDALSLRPEVTPSVVRVLNQYNLHKQRGFWKFFYMGRVFRHERPQKGRYRQFHQCGVEAIGAYDPLVDAETILVYSEVLRALEIEGVELKINSIGCPTCRAQYRDVLKTAIQPALAHYCPNCQKRLDRNVFRILDCKVRECVKLCADLPKVRDHLCDDCSAHMNRVEEALNTAGVTYAVDPRMVRGLDYYSRTVYEFSSSALGSQNAICGGGRYDSLVGDMGGPDVGSVGFAAGVERNILLLDAAGKKVEPAPLDFYVVAVGDESRPDAFGLANELRRAGFRGDLDFEARSIKAQMRSANKRNARWALVLGEQERKEGNVRMKNMSSGEDLEVSREAVGTTLKGDHV